MEQIKMKLEIEGKLTSGYRYEMDGKCPIFINNEAIDNIIEDWLYKNGFEDDFGNDNSKINPLENKRIRFTFEIIDNLTEEMKITDLLQ